MKNDRIEGYKINGGNYIEACTKRVLKEGIKAVGIKYDEQVNTEYEYLIVREAISDGSLTYVDELAEKIFLEMLNCEACYKETLPKDIENIKTIHYTVGDFFLKTEKIGSIKSDKAWLTARFILSVPIRCEYVMK